MAEPTNPRARLLVNVVEALDRATRFGKAMVTFSHGGATHERIGIIERVEQDENGIRLSGAHHSSRINPAAIASIEVDRSTRMKDKVFPRLSFCNAAGETIFAIVGFDGLEPFDAALAGCKEETLAATVVKPQPERNAETPPPEPLAFDALRLAQQSGQEVAICHGKDGFSQEWRGRIGELKPAMGFLNILDPDFHLHLKDGALAEWRLDPQAEASEAGERTYIACSAEGHPIGLTIRGSASAFAGADGRQGA